MFVVPPLMNTFAAVAPRVSASISVISSCIIIHLIRRSQAKLSTIYHRIILGMSSMSILASIAISLTTLPMPKDLTGYDLDYLVDWTGTKLGNVYTCQAQGFIFSFGSYAMFAYYVSLCVYYACVIALQIQEMNIIRYVEPFLHLFPILFSLINATIPLVLDLYHTNGWYNGWCNISTRPDPENTESEWKPYKMGYKGVLRILHEILIPGMIIFLFSAIIISFGLIIRRVAKVERALGRSSTTRSTAVPNQGFGRSASLREEQRSQTYQNLKAVIVQALAYLSVMIITLAMTFVQSLFDKPIPWVLRLKIILIPLHGFFNCLIFVYHKIFNYRRIHPNTTRYEVLKKLFLESEHDEILFSRISMVRLHENGEIESVEIHNEIDEREVFEFKEEEKDRDPTIEDDNVLKSNAQKMYDDVFDVDNNGEGPKRRSIFSTPQKLMIKAASISSGNFSDSHLLNAHDEFSHGGLSGFSSIIASIKSSSTNAEMKSSLEDGFGISQSCSHKYEQDLFPVKNSDSYEDGFSFDDNGSHPRKGVKEAVEKKLATPNSIQGEGSSLREMQQLTKVKPNRPFLIIIIVVLLSAALITIPILFTTGNQPAMKPNIDIMNVTSVHAGDWHTCAIMDNKVEMKCWGNNKHGQIGCGTMRDKTLPTTIYLPSSAARSGEGKQGIYLKQMSLGLWHTCVITNETQNNVYCWGSNKYGQLGDGSILSRYTPTKIEIDPRTTNSSDYLVYATRIEAAKYHTCAIVVTQQLNQMSNSTNQSLKCWGLNSQGQLGDGTIVDRYIPTEVKFGSDEYAVKLSLGKYHSCAITNTNILKCWGSNGLYRLGQSIPYSELSYSSLPLEIQLGTTSSGDNIHATDLSVGFLFSCIITNMKEVKCWGYHEFFFNTPNKIFPQPSLLPINNDNDETQNAHSNTTYNEYPVQFALGRLQHMCMITNSKIMKCAGPNEHGELGDGSNTLRLTHIPVDFFTGEEEEDLIPIQMSLGFEHTCNMMNDNRLRCWGNNRYGKLGDGTNTDRLFPTIV